MLIKIYKKRIKYIQLFEIPFLCFFMFCLLESGGGFAKTPNAFVFSLNNFEKLAPFVSKVMPGKAGKAIDRHSYYGPKFGSDLVIRVDASEARLGVYYSVPASVTNMFKILAGFGKQQRFSPDEVEVFYLDPSP